MSTRRAILKLIGAAPAVGASAKGELVSMLNSPAVATVMAFNDSAGQTDKPMADDSPRNLLYRQLSNLRRTYESETQAKRALRINGLDHDIAAMRSVAYSQKVRLQVERDIEEGNIFNHINRVMYGA